ncbi:uroporphyrinogen-III synthase [Spizellomyces sp. 'palustris']|nr:uroporphyrinogen-III synthase [Spizellomyces sp. 'palustris']
MTPTILFCRGRSDEAVENVQNPYETLFFASGFQCIFVPVLGHVCTNLDELTVILTEREQEYGGFIATSKRALEALKICWGRAVDTVKDFEQAAGGNWRNKPFYVVGKATGSAARDAGFRPVGEYAGTADVLSDFIINEGRPSAPLLLLAGDKARDVLPQRLAAANVPFEKVMVYLTGPLPDFEAVLAAQIEGCLGETDVIDWVVFFSPSGVDVALTSLSEMTWWDTVRCASIGPTTSRRLQEKQVKVSAEASTPCPEALLAAVLQTSKSASTEIPIYQSAPILNL